MQLHIYKNADELVNELARWITDFINNKLQTQDRFTIALSGGESPKKLYQLLSSGFYIDKIQWNKVHIFWGDERVVPFNDDRNNAKMAYENMLNNVPIPGINIHVMQTDIAPYNAAEEYEKILHTYFDNSDKSFDLVLLGMGKDAHTLSLFPGSAIIEKENWVNAVYADDQNMYRITLMPSIVNKASAIIFLVTGADKATALCNVLETPFEPTKYPAQLIKPSNGELHWFTDEDAVSEIKRKPGQ